VLEWRLICMDISKLVQTQKNLARSVEVNTVLLQEVHHRVKNNMQIISSLINMQAQRLESQDIKDALFRCRDRIQSMALVHEKLYEMKDFSKIQLDSYIQSLVRDINRAYNLSGNISLEFSLFPVSVSMKKAIPCALILNELLTNSFRHGYPDGREGCVKIDLVSKTDGKTLITVWDDGVGMPETVDVNTATTLGLLLVKSLAAQIDGTLTVDQKKGTKISLLFEDE